MAQPKQILNCRNSNRIICMFRYVSKEPSLNGTLRLFICILVSLPVYKTIPKMKPEFLSMHPLRSISFIVIGVTMFSSNLCPLC